MTCWFVFMGGEPNNPGNYIQVSGIPSCPGNEYLCAIFAEKQQIGGVGKPIITPALLSDIETSMINKLETNEVKLSAFPIKPNKTITHKSGDNAMGSNFISTPNLGKGHSIGFEAHKQEYEISNFAPERGTTVQAIHTSTDVGMIDKSSVSWFKFIGGRICCPTNYLFSDVEPECVGTTHLCAIKSVESVSCECGRSIPLLYDELICEIIGALNEKTNTPNVLLKD